MIHTTEYTARTGLQTLARTTMKLEYTLLERVFKH